MTGAHMYGLLEPLGNNLGIVEKGHPTRKVTAEVLHNTLVTEGDSRV